MTENIIKGNLKLSVFTSFPYDELRKICDMIVGLGYDCEFADNGNIIFQKKIPESVQKQPDFNQKLEIKSEEENHET